MKFLNKKLLAVVSATILLTGCGSKLKLGESYPLIAGSMVAIDYENALKFDEYFWVHGGDGRDNYTRAGFFISVKLMHIYKKHETGEDVDLCEIFVEGADQTHFVACKDLNTD